MQTKFWNESHTQQQQQQMYISTCGRYISFVSYSKEIAFIKSVQNILHDIQCTPRHVSSRTAACVQKCWALADKLTDIHDAVVKCLFVVSRSFMHKGFRCPHR
jgi:hypothetical protein